MELIRAERVVKRQSPTFQLGPIDFALDAGEVLGVCGEHGAGKTTLLRLIWGFLRPDAGTLSVFGMKPHLHQMLVRRHAGYLSESPNFDGGVTVRCHIQSAARFYEGWDETAVNPWLERFGIDPETCIRDLSRVTKVKLALISTLGHKPVLLLLDDPMTGLNNAERDEFSELLKTIAKDSGTGIVISSRHSRDLETCADSILALKAGRLSAENRTSTLQFQ